MTETYIQQENSLAAERNRRIQIAGKLNIAYLLISQTAEDRRIENYCNETFGVSSVSARGWAALWDDYRIVVDYDNPARMYKLAAGALPLTASEQKFVDFVQTVTDRFVDLDSVTQPLVVELEQ